MTDTTTEDEITVWIKTELGPDEKAYAVIVEAGSESVTITPDRAVKYAHGVLRAAHRAAYDAAVLRQLTSIESIPQEAAIAMVVEMRKDRPPLDNKVTRPFTLTPSVSQRTGEPFLAIDLDDKPLGQWTFSQAVEHATTMLGTISVAELDTAYLQALQQHAGVERRVATNMISDLEKHRDESW